MKENPVCYDGTIDCPNCRETVEIEAKLDNSYEFSFIAEGTCGYCRSLIKVMAVATGE